MGDFHKIFYLFGWVSTGIEDEVFVSVNHFGDQKGSPQKMPKLRSDEGRDLHIGSLVISQFVTQMLIVGSWRGLFHGDAEDGCFLGVLVALGSASLGTRLGDWKAELLSLLDRGWVVYDFENEIGLWAAKRGEFRENLQQPSGGFHFGKRR